MKKNKCIACILYLCKTKNRARDDKRQFFSSTKELSVDSIFSIIFGVGLLNGNRVGS